MLVISLCFDPGYTKILCSKLWVCNLANYVWHDITLSREIESPQSIIHKRGQRNVACVIAVTLHQLSVNECLTEKIVRVENILRGIIHLGWERNLHGTFLKLQRKISAEISHSGGILRFPFKVSTWSVFIVKITNRKYETFKWYHFFNSNFNSIEPLHEGDLRSRLSSKFSLDLLTPLMIFSVLHNIFQCSLDYFFHLSAPSGIFGLLPNYFPPLPAPYTFSCAPCSLHFFPPCSWLPGCFAPNSVSSPKHHVEAHLLTGKFWITVD